MVCFWAACTKLRLFVHLPDIMNGLHSKRQNSPNLCQVVHTQITTAFPTTLYIWPCMMHHAWYILFCAVQKQTTTAYCRILSTLDHHVSDIFFSLMNHDILSCRALPTPEAAEAFRKWRGIEQKGHFCIWPKSKDFMTFTSRTKIFEKMESL